MASPSEIYAERLEAVQAQNARIYEPSPSGDPWGREAAWQFRFDPRRELDQNLAIIASYVRREDTLVDVGGGARPGMPSVSPPVPWGNQYRAVAGDGCRVWDVGS